MARDWLVRIQLGDTSGAGETAGQRMEEVWRKADCRVLHFPVVIPGCQALLREALSQWSVCRLIGTVFLCRMAWPAPTTASWRSDSGAFW